MIEAEAAILNRVLDRDWSLNRRGPLSTPHHFIFQELIISSTHPSRDVNFFGQILAKQKARNYFCTWRLGAFKTSTFGITWCDDFKPNLRFEVSELFFTLGDGCWLPIISVIISPPITPNQFWGFTKRNSQKKITPPCLVPVRKKVHNLLHQNVLGELISVICFTSVTPEHSWGINCVILEGPMAIL